eukprot:4788154-Alexandrium_andersonii.AAC.1
MGATARRGASEPGRRRGPQREEWWGWCRTLRGAAVQAECAAGEPSCLTRGVRVRLATLGASPRS